MKETYEQYCKRKHLILAAQALKLEMVAFSEKAETLWETARQVRYECMDYVQIRHCTQVRSDLQHVCRRTGKIVCRGDMVYLLNVGYICRNTLTDREIKHSIYCDA